MIDLSSFSDVRVLCVGDVMLDRFINGDVKRISPESPVPVLLAGAQHDIPGGAANVSRNIVALGGTCVLVGAIGHDKAGEDLTLQLQSSEGIIPDLVHVERRPTAEKVRFVAQGQHLLRMDREEAAPLSAEAETLIIDRIASRIQDCQVAVLSDYAKGLLTDKVIAETIRLAKKIGIPVIVDPKSANLRRYDGATVVTPNINETKAATGIAPTSDDLAEQAGKGILDGTGLTSVLMTRAEHGMTLVERNGSVTHLRASAREVFDVVGAGDTVVATLSLALGSGYGLPESANLANVGAGLVVGKRGTATITRAELLDELGRVGLVESGLSQTKFSLASSLAERCRQWQKSGLTVGFTNGVFDILHVGHLHTLEFSRSNCDRLIVAINSDESVRRLKGPTRPINQVEDRVHMLSALTYVDAVVVFEEDTPGVIIDLIQPDLLVKGADYSVGEIVGAQTVLGRGGKVLTCPLVPGRSTTRIIEKAQIG